MTPQKFLIYLLGGFFAIFIGIMIYISIVISGEMPSLEQLENPKQNFATLVYSADGQLLDNYFIERRVWVPFDSIPRYFFDALISVEDRDFYNHWGVNLGRIVKAGLKNILMFDIKGGASTITQQLSRGLFFNMEQTMSRKVKEAFTAIQIERTYTKQEILELYANTVSFGKGAYGIRVAAQVYFNKDPKELTLAESAFLVGLLQRPEKYNGSKGMELAVNRRNYVLYLMEDNDKISETQRLIARSEPINFISPQDRTNKNLFAPHFVEMIRQELADDEKLSNRDLYRDGLIIYTTLDSRVQAASLEAVEEHLANYQKIFNASWSWNSRQKLLKDLVAKAAKNTQEYVSADPSAKPGIEQKYAQNQAFIDSVKNASTTLQVGMAVIEPRTGAILAMVGASPKFMRENRTAKYSLNHVTQIKRQPGSTFKPFVYASALEQGLDPNAAIDAGPYTYTLPSGETWSPSGSKEGALPLATALQLSVNTVSARLITQHTSPQKVVDLARRMGVKSPLRAVPALSLGAGGEVNPLEMISGFSTFANEGVYQAPYYIERIEDQHGNLLYQRKKTNIGVDAVSPKIAINLTRFMRGTIDGGTGYKVRSFFTGCEAAGKTGTTNDFADAWFIGFTPQLAAGIWMGFDDKRVTFTGGYGYAGEAAAPLWGKVMAKIYANETLPYKQRKFNFSTQGEAIGLDSTSISEESQVTATNAAAPAPVPAEKPKTEKKPTAEATAVKPAPNAEIKKKAKAPIAN